MATASTRFTPTARRGRRTGIKENVYAWIILTLGRDFATVNLVFKVRGKELVGRQSQTFFVRFPEDGWKVVSAHVSTTDGSALVSGRPAKDTR